MSFTADQYSQIAQGYDQAVADPLVTPERKEEFAKKAKWFHFLAQRESKHARHLKEDINPQLDGNVIAASDSPRRSMAPFLTMLWLTGAVLYLFSTLLFTNAVNLFGDEDRKLAVAEASRPIESSPKVVKDDIGAKEQNNRRVTPAAERPHAISPDQPTYEDPALTAPPSQPPEPEVGIRTAAEPVVPDMPRGLAGEVLTVTADATIRISPSISAKKIGTATSGAELVLTAREPDWVQFIDPSSGNRGWIRSSLVAPASRAGAESLAPTREAENQTVETPSPNPAKKRANAKPTAPNQADQKRRYVELPHDEGFSSARSRGPGLLAKRRMLREGLLSPGFLPPR